MARKASTRPSVPSKTRPDVASDVSQRSLTYADAGVDLDTYDQFIDTVDSVLKRTHGPRVIQNPGGFAGLFRLDYNEKLFKRNYKDPVLVACTDGVGTKVSLASKARIFDGLGIDLVAMSVNDLIVQGAEPLIFLDYIAVEKVDKRVLGTLLKSVAEGCRIAGCALIGGETAEMPGVYRSGELDMAGFAVGVVELRRAMNPLRVLPGDVVLGLASSGVHSNGYSLVRKVVEHAGLELDRVYPELEGPKGEDKGKTLAQVLLTPTRIYADSIVRTMRQYKVKQVVSGMAHITGGGLADNLVRALSDKVDARIDAGSWPTLPVFRFLQKHGNIAETEMRRVFNMGIGYCVIVKPTFADAVAERLAKCGEKVYPIGKIVKGTGKVTGA
ncbi:MAG: phosphoribosylformylglycinamidine cyclo-ligase [Phycisphaeraceae bacterium]|nr:phosphoribosylformylglycinamidine cyclo-ligase [Phycisphaeraceae bacterium]MBX3366148.1 phosphoribosylformylglycinamidine cyclo-ligase [Phycisphaeraceae bacterium]QYK48646.1 MAG: phosphoribosylformylglycinamidine cyclo-ligase [Phycisphaeraceae bacterium]